MRRLVDRFFGRLRQRIAILLAVLALLSLAPWALAHRAHGHLDGAALRLDAVGSLRYRLMQLGLASATGAPRAELDRIAEAQLRTLERLIEGDAALPACAPADACARLREHARRWREELVPAARTGEGLGALAPAELAALDATVHGMAAATQDDVARLERAGALATSGGALLVVLAALAVWEVFARIRRLHDATEASSPEVELEPLAGGRDELAAVARAIQGSLAALRRAGEAERARVEQLLSAIPDAVLVVRADGTIDYANARVGEVFGWRADELVGASVETLVPAAVRGRHAGLRGSFAKEPAARAMGSGLDLRVERRDGTTFFADISLGPVTLAEAPMVVAAVRDVSERPEARRRLEDLGAALERANRELAGQNAELEQFAFAASHDMQEPLRKIIAFGDRIAKGYGSALDERGRDYLARMQSAAARMQLLIDDLLRWSRLTTRAEPFTPVDLDAVMRDVLDDLEVAIEKAGATVRVGPLPTIDADAPQMRQLFQNLIGNAIKYRKEGCTPVIDVFAAPLGDRVRLVVRDDGIGFDPKYAERIFDVFERLHGRKEYEGTGIGLALCRKIVRRHGGEIGATSEPGEGATFTAVLPVRQPGEERSAA